MSATTAEFGSTPASNTASDANVVDLLDSETEVGIFVVGKQIKQDKGVHFSNT